MGLNFLKRDLRENFNLTSIPNREMVEPIYSAYDREVSAIKGNINRGSLFQKSKED